MVYYVFIDVKKRNTAGLKAPADIAQICDECGYTRFTIPRFPEGKSPLYNRLWLLWAMAGYSARMLFRLKKGDLILMQHPNYGVKPMMKVIPLVRRWKGAKFAILIHDLNSLRGWFDFSDKRNALADGPFLDTFDYVISHNSHMSRQLIANGVHPDKLIDLGLFDYLSSVERQQPPKSDVPSIAIAGYLGRRKCGYIYALPADLRVHLYGNDFEQDKAGENMCYHGSFKPEELPAHLVGDFGLVWDGDSAQTCSGTIGNYLRYNNPHKASLYLSSNMPVVVWKQAAIADFVLENGVGIAVSSLHEIPAAIRAISPEEYRVMCENVKKISKKLKSGSFFRAAIGKCR